MSERSLSTKGLFLSSSCLKKDNYILTVFIKSIHIPIFWQIWTKPCYHLLLPSLPTYQALFSSAKSSATSSLSRSRLFCSNWCLKDEGDVLSRIDSLPQWATHHQLDLLQLGTLTSKQKIVCGVHCPTFGTGASKRYVSAANIGIPHLATLIDAFRVQIIIWSSPVFKMLTDFWWLVEKFSNSKPLSFPLSLSTSFLGYELPLSLLESLLRSCTAWWYW